MVATQEAVQGRIAGTDASVNVGLAEPSDETPSAALSEFLRERLADEGCALVTLWIALI